MEAGDTGARQSHPISATEAQPGYYDHLPRAVPEESQQESSVMATAALISPSTPFYPHSSPYSPTGGYPYHTGQSSQAPAMISPVDSTRRPSDDTDANHRHSLPSIQDIMGPKPNGPPLSQGLPSPFAASAPPNGVPPVRAYADAPPPSLLEKRPSPGAHHHSQPSFPRSEPLSALAAAPRPGPPPLSIFASSSQAVSHPHLSPSVKPEAHEMGQHGHRPLEGPHLNGYGHHSHQPPAVLPPAPSPYSQHPPVPLPPGQLPLSGYPISPRHHVPPLPSPFESQRPPLGPEDDYRRGHKFDGGVGRNYDWTYTEQLARIGTTARTILHFAQTYDKIAQEDHGPPPPSRMPSEVEIADMMSSCDWLKSMLENVRVVVKQTTIDNAREGSRARSNYADDEEMPLYGADPPKQPYGIVEVKKRRGRAAPPGRCHSCNRVDTPEWRRGPDGARTLCNACGLHYAKLERKRNESARPARPKPVEDRMSSHTAS